MKHTFRIILLLLFFSSFSQTISGQVSVRDSTISAGLFFFNYSFQVPDKDLSIRFGNNSSIGGGFLIKTKSNWLLGADFNYIFGSKVKNSDDILKNISTNEGWVIDIDGLFAEINFFERGFYSSVKFGKIFPIAKSNPNSGLMITGSIGLLQHKIRIDNPKNTAPQLTGDYKKGYDQLSNGLCISEFIGYMHMGNNRLTNFYVGFEFLQGWTQSRRDYDFNLMVKDTSTNFDILNGLKIGWIIPLYKQVPDKFYYY